MIKIDNTEVIGWEHAIRSMRNPKNSWDRSDSYHNYHEMVDGEDDICDYVLGANDLKLATTLANAGTEHGKFLRMINVYVDVTAPLYWYKEMDTYKVGTVCNSCSTMHKIHAKEFTLDDFSHEHLFDTCILEKVINELNIYRSIYVDYDNQTDAYQEEFSKKDIWWQMIQLLPSSYNQKRTYMLNYAVLRNIYHQRKNHKLDEWHVFCDWIKTLPYADELITCELRAGEINNE